MGLYKRDGSALWWCRFQVGGVEYKQSTRTADRRQAEVEERRLRSLRESASPHRRSPGTHGLADLAGLDGERAAAAGTTKAYQHGVETSWQHIVDHFGVDCDPREITYDKVQTYIVARRAEGAKGHTILRETTALRRGLKAAYRKRWLTSLPVEWPSVRLDPVGAKGKGKLHPPVIIARWLAALPPRARDQAEVAVLTSLRCTELERLTAQWIEPAPDGAGVASMIRVPAWASKVRKERLIPLVPRAHAILARLAQDTPPGLPLLPPRQKHAFERARKAIGYGQHISLRDLRHTWGTLANRAVGIDAARDGLGHSTLAMTNRYVSGDLGRTAEAALAIEALVGPCAGETGANVSKSEQKRTTSFRDPAVVEHLRACNYCWELVVATVNAHVPGVVVGTVDPAQVAPSPARARTR